MSKVILMTARHLLLVALIPISQSNSLAATTPPADELNKKRPAKQTSEDIVVRGTKRATSFLASDVAVTVLTKEILEQARIRDLRQIDRLVPNVHFNAAGQLSNMYISIRGVESNPYLVNRAAVYIDGIPFREISNSVLNEVESVEVLRGPQGTLYGANSESGLILVSTKAPTNAREAQLRTTMSGFEHGYETMTDGFVGGPLIKDKLVASLAFMRSDGNSYLYNIAPYNGTRGYLGKTYGQARVRWTPTENITINALSYGLKTYAPGMFEYEYVPIDISKYNQTYGSIFNRSKNISSFTYANDAPKLTNKNEEVGGMSGEWRLPYGRFNIAGSYRHETVDSRGYDLDMTAAPILAGEIYNNSNIWNTELRFMSPDHKPVEYMLGVSVYGQGKSETLGTEVGPGTLTSYNRAPLQYSHGRDDSLFGNISYTPSFLSRITFTAGLRYDRAHRNSRQAAGSLDLGPSGIIAYRAVKLSNVFPQILPRFAIRYRVLDDLSVYASAVKGFIPGGFNLSAVQAGIDDSKILKYRSESLWTEEIGFKWRTPDKKGHISGAIYNIDCNNWQEIQVATDSSGRPVTSDYIGSGAAMRSRGFEVETDYKIARDFSLIGNIGYNDARYKHLVVNPRGNLRGNHVMLTPQYNALIAAYYRHKSGFFIRAEVNFNGKMALDERNRAFQPATSVVGLQTGYEAKHYTGRLFVENLTNRRRFDGLALDNLAFGRDGNLYGSLSAPRIFGLEISGKI